ncbi:MAG: type II toxin-antitoxin system HicB family antitoxin [Gammaproteobacteria bacterium]|nr:type II toxin-antitoxin system HicB family antitoxin [Gammaproteobacteria bacterium]MXW44899.1 type II toxin-antitoxin system HicB family antitoxin [Gammaproteobacteria bacterium]MYD02935.1 type II toxin-antitoxin system HicB family antitoxin [Gammaproteobacteria bacterium]MYI26012.1 type II toxin-antitoxin system HicB family antitoxin [Gammaproteobacteria bacterium]
MRFRYPVRLVRDHSGEVIASCRDLPECLTSGFDEENALWEAQDALEEAIAGRIDDGEPIPVPSPRRDGEKLVTVPPQMAAKAAFALAFRNSGLSRLAFARRMGVNEKVVRRMLDPRHHTAANRIHRALRLLGQELVVESRAA